jgi:hypothetical protein
MAAESGNILCPIAGAIGVSSGAKLMENVVRWTIRKNYRLVVQEANFELGAGCIVEEIEPTSRRAFKEITVEASLTHNI